MANKTPAEIAAKLSPAVRKAMLTDTTRGNFSSATRDRMVKAGLIYDHDWVMTPLGQEVRAALRA
jgi:hypothetical protein